MLSVETNYATRSTTISFCQPERKFNWTCDLACNVLGVMWLTGVIFRLVGVTSDLKTLSSLLCHNSKFDLEQYCLCAHVNAQNSQTLLEAKHFLVHQGY